MKRKIITAILILASVICLSRDKLMAQRTEELLTPPAFPQLEPVTKDDRILILAPHPDDEALAVGGLIQKALKAGADLRIVYLTNGDSNQLSFIVYQKRIVVKKNAIINMGEIRRKEAIAAMRSLGVSEDKLIFLGYPDFGMLQIFLRYWGDAKPYKSLLTRALSVPYKDALSPNAPYKGEAILWDMESVIKKYQPTKIFVTNPVDTNGDHKALNLFLRVALWDLKGQIPEPKIYPYLVHCYGWPRPRNYHPDFYLDAPPLLKDEKINWRTLDLSGEELAKKYEAICLYKSQCADSAFYLKAFARRNELFGGYNELRLADNTFEGPPNTNNRYAIYGRSGGNLIIKVFYKQDSERGRRFFVHLIGYNPQIDFSHMPKIKINVSSDGARLLSGGKFITEEGLITEQKDNHASLTIPLETLGNPKYILTSIAGYSGNIPSEMNAWRVIEIE